MSCRSPLVIANGSSSNTIGKTFRKVSCGRCNACKKSKRDAWLFRLKKESQRWDFQYFITLTYDNEHLPYSVASEFVDIDTGEIRYIPSFPTLVSKDCQDWLKRLRYFFKFPLKYYICGEYGVTRRPHYHAIIFTDNAIDKRFLFMRRGEPYFTSDLVGKSWKFGYHTIDDLNESRVGYVLKYLYKPSYLNEGVELPFHLNSIRMGSNVFTREMVNFWFSDPSNFYVKNGDLTIPMPKYYKDILLRDSPDYRQQISDYLNVVVPKRKADSFADFCKRNPNEDVNVLLNKYDAVQQHVILVSNSTHVL